MPESHVINLGNLCKEMPHIDKNQTQNQDTHFAWLDLLSFYMWDVLCVCVCVHVCVCVCVVCV